MTIITRKVYVADDGEEFTSAKQCSEYEANGNVTLVPLPNYGDHGPITGRVFWRALNGDGSGYYATETKMSRERVRRDNHPAWATHVVYFGK